MVFYPRSGIRTLTTNAIAMIAKITITSMRSGVSVFMSEVYHYNRYMKLACRLFGHKLNLAGKCVRCGAILGIYH